MFEYSRGGDSFLAASHRETRLVFDGLVDEDRKAGGAVIVLAWSTEDLVEGHFVKATNAFDRSMQIPDPGVGQLSRTTHEPGTNRFFA